MLLRPTRAAVVKTRTDQHAVRVLRNELNEHIRPGHVVWGASKFSNKPGAKVEPQWYAFFVMEVRMPRGDSLEVTIVGKWLHKLEYLQRCDRKGLIGEKWSGRGNVWFFTNQSQTLGAHLVLSAVTTVPVRIGSDGALFDARSGVKVPAYLSDDTFTADGPCDDVILSQETILVAGRATLDFDLRKKRKQELGDTPKLITKVEDFDSLPLDFSVADFTPGFMSPPCAWGEHEPDDEIEQRHVGVIESGPDEGCAIMTVCPTPHSPTPWRVRRPRGTAP